VKYAVLSCSGMDKAEGSLAREVAIRFAEKTGADIVCPVLLSRTASRYKKLLAEEALVIIDGCGTRCASKLTAGLDARTDRKLSISDALKARGLSPGTSLRLEPADLALVESIVDDLIAELAAPPASPAPASVDARQEAASSSDIQNWEPPNDFAVVVHDKYEFHIPTDDYFFNENDVWARPLGDRARVGISDYMQQRLTDVNYFDPPEVGAQIEHFGEVGSVESVKAAFEVVSPVSGRVVAVNEAVVDRPELVNEDPYGRGWLAELELADWQGERELLLRGADYAKIVEQKAAEE
jgi:glycine cleavage system H protein